jgi:alpha-mannosidase
MAPCETYCSRANIEDLQKSVTNHKDLRYTKAALVPFGFGDGGGGPTAEQLEKLRRLRGIANKNPGAIPKHTVGPSVDDFFNHIRAETDNGKNLDSFFGELVGRESEMSLA